MNNKNAFGLLLIALRELYGWTQQELADRADVFFKKLLGPDADFDVYRVNALENGKKKNVNINEIRALADAFSLNPLEKEKFFLQAMKINSHTLLGDERNHIEVFNYLKDIISKIRQPAYIYDAYGDVVAGNLLIAEFLGISMEYINTAKDNPEYFNILHIIASEQSGYSKHFDKHTWQATLERNVQFVKRISLQYRYKKSFRDCLSRLFEIPLIKTYWENKPKSSQSDVRYSNVENYTHPHPIYGTLEYTAKVSSMMTQCGELYLTVYSATNDNTQALITDTYNQLKNQVSDMYMYGAVWPKPDMFEDANEN